MSQVEENAPQVRIAISEVLSLLDQGKSRKEIAEHYGQSMVAMQKMVWSNPKLKNRKAKKQYADLIVLEDDVVEEVEVVTEVEAVETVDTTTEEVAATEEVAPVEEVTTEGIAPAEGQGIAPAVMEWK